MLKSSYGTCYLIGQLDEKLKCKAIEELSRDLERTWIEGRGSVGGPGWGGGGGGGEGLGEDLGGSWGREHCPSRLTLLSWHSCSREFISPS